MPKIGLRAVVVGSLVAGTLATVVGAASPAQAIGPNAIRTFSNTSTLASTDDGATAKVPLGFSLNFYGTTYSQVIVNENGALTFDRAANANFLNGPLTVFGTKIIAPFSADLDTRPLGSNLVTYGTGTVNGRPSFAATWPGVGCYVNATTTNNSVLNYLQVVLIDRSDTGVGNFDIEFNYDQIKWDTAAEDNTPSAGNSQCVGGTNVWAPRAGYSNGVAADTELTGSGITGTFLDGGVNSLVGHSLNSTQLGRYVFRNPTSTSVAGTLSDGTSSGATLNTDYRKPVTDAAVLSGQTATAGGTITYTAYSNATCTTSVASGGTKPVVNGVPPASNPFNLGAGTYYLLASYSGDAQNRAASTGCGTQVLTVAPLPVTVTANDRSNTFGDADPAFTFVATGLQGTDRFLTLPSCGVSGAHAGAGTYPITCSGASAGANYTVSYVAGTLTVNPAQATVTADDQSKVYGTADPTFGYHTSSGVTLTTLPTCGVSGVHHDVGNYPIVCNRAVSDTNHTLTYVAGSLKITKAPVVVSPDDQAITFGDPAPLFTYSTTGLLGADTLTNGPTCGVGGPHVDAGTYPIGCSGADAGGNYVISYAVGHLTIAKAAVAVVPNSQAITYGDADPTFTYTVTGLPSGDSLATVPTCQVAGAHSDAGSYAITCSGADAGGNYTIDQSASAGFTVSPRTVTVTAADQAITYGDADPSFTSTATGLVPGDSLSTPATCAVDGTHSDAGSYRITCSAAAASANYDIRYADGTLTVDEAPLTITADSQSAVYGSPDPTLSYTVAVLHDGDQLDAAPTCAVESHHHVGSYAITCSDAAARNYRIVYADGTLTITPATVTITADDQTRIYGNADSRFTYALAGLLGDDSFTTRPTCGVDGSHRDTGTYPITCSDADAGADYTIAYAPGMLAVTPATLHIAASDESTVYGAGDPAFGFQTTGLVGSDTLTAPPACGVEGAHTAARTYPITCSGADGGSDYLIAYSPATLTVNRAGVIVTASDATTVYGTPDPAFGDAVSGLVGDDVLTIEPTCGVDGVHHDVGPYPITCAGADAGDNYTVDYLPGTLMVTKASAVVTPDSQSIVYGDPDPTYAYTTSGLVGGDALVHAAICTVNGTHQDANTYPITCSGADAGGNYTMDYAPGSLTVATAPGVVTPDPQAITYGDPDPTFSYTVSGLKGGDALGTQPTCGVTGSHTAAGHYVIRCSGADAGPDYTLDQSATATLTVRPKAIMVTADNRGITYGQADAAFTSTVSGLVGSDQLTVPGTCGVSASHTAAGSYPITCSGADGGGNYTISYAAGTLGVAKAVLTVNAPSPSTTYGVKASTVSLAPTYGGLVNADTPSSAGVASASCATAASVTSGGSYPAGSFPVTCSGPTGTANYTVHYSAGTLTVGSATLTVTARDASRPYGAADPAFTTTVSGLVNSDTASAAYSGTAATATTATATSPAGSYPITVASGTLTSTNYTFAFASGTLTVTAATTSLTAAAVLVTLGGHSAQVNVGTISATLRYGSSARPVVGATITFTARSIAVCAAVTDATGKATCSLTAVQDAKVISSLGYTATFVGSSDLLGSSGSAGLIQFR